MAAVLEISLQTAKARPAQRSAEVSRDGFGIRDVEEVRDLIVEPSGSHCACLAEFESAS